MVSLSSAESELYGMVSGLCDGLHIRQCIQFVMGLDSLVVHHLGDSSAARGILQRTGTGGRVKHIEGRILWVQEKLQTREIVLNVVQTRWNLADLHTKSLSSSRCKMLQGLLGYHDEDGHIIGAEELEQELGKIQAKGAIRQARIELGKHVRGSTSGAAKQLLQLALLQSMFTRSAGYALSWNQTETCHRVEDSSGQAWLWCAILAMFVIVCIFAVQTWISTRLREVDGNFQTANLRIEELHDEQVIMLQRIENISEQIDRLERYIISDFHEQTTEQTRLADGTIPFDGEARRLDE